MPAQTTPDGTVIWETGGRSFWQPNHPYTGGQLILDGNNNIQIVQTAGTSGPSVPIWDPNPGQATQEQIGGVVWNNLGHDTWQPQTNYSPGQAIIDSTGSIQTATNQRNHRLIAAKLASARGRGTDHAGRNHLAIRRKGALAA